VSVINQMLKDLDKRSPEPGESPVTAMTAQKPSTLKIVLVSVVILLSLNALGFYIWDLQQRAANGVELQNNEQLSNVNKVANQTSVQSDLTEKEIKQEHVLEQVKLNETSIMVAVEPNEVPSKQAIIEQEEPIPAITVSAQKKLTRLAKNANAIEEIVIPVVIEEPKVVKMSVSRRQLTTAELVSQKLTQAEKAVNLNEIKKAEVLFEDILILEPAQKQARKKLAALWFGRKSYSQAINLLSQGIALDKQDAELRLLKARIYLAQGQHENAYNTLTPLSSIEHEEYQHTLANVAQQIEQYTGAISAYKVLLNMQPYSGRWHLGLAIVYDKNSQFSLAVNEYSLALTKTDLSASSAQFAKQRMQALGE
jgi:MSHA biogenesis protein MshN